VEISTPGGFMETKNNSKRIHPLVAAAAVGVLLVSLVGVAAMTGILPNSNSASSQKEAVAALEKEAADKAAEAQAAEDKASQARKEADERQAAANKAEKQAKRESDTKGAQAHFC
jgi:FKBP-type peptidyl-prolyl cis-trans isomerase